MPSNQMALHTLPGCYQNYTPPNQIGETLTTDCSSAAGCTVGELQPNSYGNGFAAAGGGIFAAQFDVAGLVLFFTVQSNTNHFDSESCP